MTTARYGNGLMSRSTILKRWSVPSNSNPSKSYEVQLHDDGILTCNCRGWINHSNRVCHHVRDKHSAAQTFLTGTTNYPGTSHKLDKVTQQVVAPKIAMPTPAPKPIEKVIEKVVAPIVQKPKFKNHRMIRMEIAQS